MTTRNDLPPETAHEDNQPNASRHAMFAGDDTGRIEGGAAPSIAPDQLPHETLSPSPTRDNPGMPSNTHEDAGWEPEQEGSLLAHEREGVPQGDVPENIPESATRARPKAQP